MQQNQEHDYLNITAASSLAGVSRQWLSILADRGDIPGMVNHGGFRLFDRAAFGPWAEEQKRTRKRRWLTKS